MLIVYLFENVRLCGNEETLFLNELTISLPIAYYHMVKHPEESVPLLHQQPALLCHPTILYLLGTRTSRNPITAPLTAPQPGFQDQR